jgi:hypothetical protein
MTKKIKAVYKLYRRYEDDVWGDLHFRTMGFRLFLFFNFILASRLRIPQPRFNFDAGVTRLRKNLKRYKTKAQFFIEKQKIRRFYGNMSEQEFKEIANAVSYRRTTRHQSFSFLLGLERRLDTIAFRFYMGKTILEAREFVLAGCLLVDKKVKRTINYRITNNQILTFAYPKKMIALWKYWMRFYKKRGLKFRPFPSQFWFSYKHLFFRYNPTSYPKHHINFPFKTRYTSFLSSYY